MPTAELELFGQAIRVGRASKKWSQRVLGEKAGLKMWRIWALENNVYQPRPDELARILQALSTATSVGPDAQGDDR